MTLLLLSEVFGPDGLVIISNFLVAFSTLLLWTASEHEQHQTVKAIVKANNALVRTIVNALGGKPKK